MTSVLAQEQPINIVINDSLPDNSENYSVKIGALKKYKFGDYTVVKKKTGIASIGTKNNVSRKHAKFAFTLTNKKSDSAFFKAEFNEITSYEIKEDRLLHILTDMQVISGIEASTVSNIKSSKELKATIAISGNKNIIWTLLMEEGSHGWGVEGELEGSITNGERTIYITKVDYDKKNPIKYFDYVKRDSITIPRLRYEFIENKQSLGAVKYEGSLIGSVWFNLGLSTNPEVKLILASVMISILRIQDLP